jgi:hypothetical protein
MFQSKTTTKNYYLITECREFVARMLNEMRTDEIANGKKWFSNVLIEAEENSSNIGDINAGTLETSNGQTVIPADTLLTFDFDKQSQSNWGIDDQDLSSNQRVLAISTYFHIRTKKSKGKKQFVEYLVKYIKDNLTKNDLVYSSLLATGDGWSGNTYSSNLFANYDLGLQSPDLMSDPDTNWYKYDFQLILNIFYTSN